MNCISSAGGSTSTLRWFANAATSITLNAPVLSRDVGGTLLIDANTLGNTTAGFEQIKTVPAPAIFLGGGSTGPLINIIQGVWAGKTTSNLAGDTSTFVTYDPTVGIRQLATSEFATSITSGASTLNNVAPSGTTTLTASSTTTINSIRFGGPTAGTVTAGATIAIGERQSRHQLRNDRNRCQQ